MVKFKINIFTVIKITILFFAIFSFIICLNYGTNDFLWVIPLFYIFCFYIFILKNKFFTRSSLFIINICCFLRYAIVPYFYYKMNDYVPDFFFWWWRNKIEIFYNNQVILIMVLEMVSIFISMYIFSQKSYFEISTISEKDIILSQNIFILSPGVMLVLLILIVVIKLLLPIDIEHHTINVFINFFQTCILTIMTLVITLWIKKTNYIHCDKLKLLITLAVWTFFAVQGALWGEHIGRWCMIIRIFIGWIILKEIYRKQFKLLSTTLGSLLIGLIGITTVLKFELSDMLLADKINSIFNYGTFNAYFSGPTNIACSVKMKEFFGSNYSILTFINDIFGNFPILNHLFSGINRSVCYFNYVFYGNRLVADQIIPMSGQCYGLFGYFGVVGINIIITYLAIKMDSITEKTIDIFMKYILLYCTIGLSFSTFLNIAIIGQLFWIDILPLFIIKCGSYFVIRLKKTTS